MGSFDLLSWLQGYQGLLLLGLWQTLLISILAYLIGLLLGLCLALANGSGVRAVQNAIRIYSYLFRALPELILIMLLYYASGDLFGWLFKLLGFGRVQLNGTAAAITVLALVSAAFACEIFGAAIKAVPVGMVENAIVMGMGRMLRFRRIVFPIMLPLALPGLANLWLMVVRGSSLVSVVGVMELALATEQGAGATKAYFTFYLTGMGLYLAVALFTLQLFYKAERHLRRGQLAI